MFSVTELYIEGHKQQKIPNTFIKQRTRSQHIAIVFPGYGYDATKPALHYSIGHLIDIGADVLIIIYEYNKEFNFKTFINTQLGLLFSDTKAISEKALIQGEFNQITLVGKSFGTLAMGFILENDKKFKNSDCIWLTPLLNNKNLVSQIQNYVPKSSLFIMGTADNYYDSAIYSKVSNITNGSGILLDGVNHALDIDNDIIGSIDSLKIIVQSIVEFVQ